MVTTTYWHMIMVYITNGLTSWVLLLEASTSEFKVLVSTIPTSNEEFRSDVH